MRRVGPRAVWFWLLLVAVPTGGAATETASTPLEGRIASESPLHLEGRFEASTSSLLTWDHAGDAGPAGTAFTSPLAILRIQETTWKRVDASTPGHPMTYDTPADDREAQFVVRNVRLASTDRPAVDGYPAQQSLRFGSDTPHSVRVADGVACDVEPLIGRLDPSSPTLQFRTGGTESSPWLRADCAVGDVEATGNVTAYFVGPQVLATGDLQEGGASVPRTWNLASGYSIQPNGTLPRVFDCAQRTITLESIASGDEAARMSAGPLRRFAVTSPALAAAGELAIPAFEGRLRWGAWETNESQVGLRPNGVIGLAAHESARIGLAGTTFNGPPAAPLAALAPAPPPRDDPTVLVVAAASGGVLALVALVLWHRRRGDEADQNPVRGRLLELLHEVPGLGPSAAARRLAVARRTVRHHANVLARQGRITILQGAGRNAMFPVGLVSNLERRYALVYSRPLLRRLLATIQERPSPSQVELALRLGTSQATVSRALRRLGGLGLIRVEWLGGSRVYVPTGALSVPLPATPVLANAGPTPAAGGTPA